MYEFGTPQCYISHACQLNFDIFCAVFPVFISSSAPQYPLPVCANATGDVFNGAKKRISEEVMRIARWAIHPRAGQNDFSITPAPTDWLAGWGKRGTLAAFLIHTKPTPVLHKRLKMRLCGCASTKKGKSSWIIIGSPARKVFLSHTHTLTHNARVWAPRIKIPALKWNENKRESLAEFFMPFQVSYLVQKVKTKESHSSTARTMKTRSRSVLCMLLTLTWANINTAYWIFFYFIRQFGLICW